MCFDSDGRPPIPPIAGAAVDGEAIVLTAADGNRLAAFAADAGGPGGAAVVILPDVRGLHRYYEELALRFAEAGVDAVAIDYFGRTGGASARGEGFDYMSHVARTSWAGLRADVAAATARLRTDRAPRATFCVGFCFGGRLSFALSTSTDLGLTGVVGFYGRPTGSGANDVPAPAEHTAEMGAAVLGIFGGADQGIPAEAVAQFEMALREDRIEHTLITYPGAPHSFFDRRQTDFADASAAAWAEVLDFIRRRTPPA